MEIEYDRFKGVRLTYEGKSIFLRGIEVGKPGAILSDKQIIGLAKSHSHLDSALDAFRADLEAKDLLPFRRVKLTDAEAPRLSDNSAFKFTDDEGLAYWLRGSIRLTPPATYLSIENPHARDIREGRGLVYLQGKTCFATTTLMSGFNSLLICTSSDARRSERRKRMVKFGRRIIKIRDVDEFSQRIANLAGATSFLVRDVTYSDAKAVKGFSDFPDHATQFIGELNESKLEYIAINWMDELIRLTNAASIFTKPSSYYNERERRFQFSFPTNVTEPRVVEDSSLSELIELVC
jgi:hypothetical protein